MTAGVGRDDGAGKGDKAGERSRWHSSSFSFPLPARNLVVPGRVKVRIPLSAVISKRSEKSRVFEDAFLGADDGCMRSLTAFEMTAGVGRDDGAGKGDKAGERSRWHSSSFSFPLPARNLVVPGRVKVRIPLPAVISKRSEKSRVFEYAFLGVDDGCMRSLTALEMTAGVSRDDS